MASRRTTQFVKAEVPNLKIRESTNLFSTEVTMRNKTGFSFDGMILGGIKIGSANSQQAKAIATGVEGFITGMVHQRLNKGITFFGNTKTTRFYSRNKLTVPAKKTARSEPSPEARRRYEQMMMLASGRSLGMRTMATGVSESESKGVRFGPNALKRKKPSELARGGRVKAARRRWLTFQDGYAQVQNAVGNGPRVGLRFTGKMLEDLGVSVTIHPKNHVLQYTSNVWKNTKVSSKGTPRGTKVGFGTSDLAFSKYQDEPQLRRSAHVSGGRTLRKAFFEIKWQFGFATRRSWQVARWLERGKGRFGFTELDTSEISRLTERMNVIAEGGTGTGARFALEPGPGGRLRLTRRGGNGRLIPVNY